MGLLKRFNEEANAATDVAEDKDTLGGGGILESDLYKLTIETAYMDLAASGALAVSIQAVTDDGRKFRTTQYPISGNAKGNKHYYERNGQKFPLPGFTTVDSICQLTTGKKFFEQEEKECTIPLYNYDAAKELPTKVNMLTDLIGKKFIGGITRQKVDKNVKNNEGKYVPSGDTREVNELDKVFNEDGLTLTEYRSEGINEGVFVHTWKDKFKGQVIDKSTKGVVPPPSSAPSAAAPVTASGLFD